MRVLITGICGFVGSTLARTWIERGSGHTLLGIDSLVRPGSERNRQALRRRTALWTAPAGLATHSQT